MAWPVPQGASEYAKKGAVINTLPKLIAVLLLARIAFSAVVVFVDYLI